MKFKCSVCLDNLFSENTDVCATLCGHLFHKDCIDGAMQNNLQCPNCNGRITEDMINKLHPDVFDELACNDCSTETKRFLEEIYNNDKEKRKTMLKILKMLDKENTSLKETNKTKRENYNTCKTFWKIFQKDKKDLQKKKQKLKLKNKTERENYNICKTFLKIFQKDKKDLQENIQKLKLKINNLHAKIGELNNDEVVNKQCGNSQVKFKKQIEKNVCEDTCIQGCTNIAIFYRNVMF